MIAADYYHCSKCEKCIHLEEVNRNSLGYKILCNNCYDLLSTEPNNIDKIIEWAKLFHDTYESLAGQFGYETRIDTRVFNPESDNGKLMIAVCDKVLTQFEKDIREQPMGASQWKELGKRYKYWDYFEEDIIEKALSDEYVNEIRADEREKVLEEIENGLPFTPGVHISPYGKGWLECLNEIRTLLNSLKK